MAAVTQSVPDFLKGVSRRPDQDKELGHVRDAINVYPDMTFGMSKRPGISWVADLGTEAAYNNAFWFKFQRSATEIYIGAIVNSTVSMWNLNTGSTVNVNGSTSTYLSGTRNDFSVAHRRNKMIIVNKTKVVGTTGTTSGSLTGTVTAAGNLPTSPNNGDVYHVINTFIAEDDYFVIYSNGAWQETVKPGIVLGLDPATMPLELQFNTSTNDFTLGAPSYINRLVGDDTTNPFPSFVGTSINEVFFHNNRLGFLCDSTVILSRVVSIFNFFRESALTLSEGDVIDLLATSQTPVTLFAVIPQQQGLVLFSSSEQFLMYADEGVLTPSKTTIRTIANFEMDVNIDPVSIGQQIVFTGSAPTYTRVFSMNVQGDQNNSLYNDIGKVVSEWIPTGLDRLVGSSQNSFIALSGPGLDYVYLFRTYEEGEKTVFKSWFKWQLPGPVQAFDTSQDQVQVVCKVGGRTVLLRGFISPTAATATLTTEDGLVVVNPCVDMLAQASAFEQVVVGNTSNNYVAVPFSPVLDAQGNPDLTNAIVMQTDSSSGSSSGAFFRPAEIVQRTIGGSSYWTFNVKNLDLSVYNTASTLFIGYTYDMSLEMPKVYFRNGESVDTTASLIINRMKYSCGNTGAISFALRERSETKFTTVGEVVQSNYYKLDSVPVDDERIFDLPVHRRNDSFDVKISSDSPYPVSLLSMSWEGQYSPRYYKRA
jgi:hypothetical protein